MWKALKRFDYTPEDCLKFADSIAKVCVPLMKELDEERRSELKLPKLRPWDLAVDPKNRPPLQPFADSEVENFIDKTKAIFDRMSPELGQDFESLRRNKNLDLQSRKGKQPGGYQAMLDEVRQRDAGARVQFSSSSFPPEESLRVVSMAIIGGLGSPAGAVLGAVYVLGLPALLGDSAQIQILTSGVGLLEMAGVVIGYAVGPWILHRYLDGLPSLGVIAASLGLTALVYAPIAAFQLRLVNRLRLAPALRAGEEGIAP